MTDVNSRTETPLHCICFLASGIFSVNLKLQLSDNFAACAHTAAQGRSFLAVPWPRHAARLGAAERLPEPGDAWVVQSLLSHQPGWVMHRAG